MELLDKEQGIYLLDHNTLTFPTLEQMKDDLVCIGGDFLAQRIIKAYESGLFPWFIDEYNHIHWYSPKKRMVLYPSEFKVSKSLKRTLKNKGFIIKSNENFEEVIKSCSSIKRKHEDETWISDEFIQAYINLFNLGYAFSIECYLDEKLVGGLYGLLINGIFCGESMFSLENNASKVVFYHLCKQATANNIKLIDCQVYNEHLSSLGAKEISREEYFKILKS